ncbi:DUF2235 domain-containing protein [Tranquillimonas rosea]|uniref:DUF2235 domain-containing protein n=1 Tax=Tranquillimonas rosea TaxID=641238 RepID=UPI003BAA466A
MRLSERLWAWLDRVRQVEQSPKRPRRGRVDHVIILDGTMSSLVPGEETNAGLLYRLLQERLPDPQLSLRYEAGIQWQNWRATMDVVEGRGINRQIVRAYGALASRYRPGDRIYLFGFSRGAYAARSLAGVIDQMGLVRHDRATERTVRQAYHYYRYGEPSHASRAFSRLNCHEAVEIEMIGVWDTVKALGLRVPFLWQLSEAQHGFHNHDIGQTTRNGFHALALDETREAYAPVLWNSPEDFEGRIVQMWFRGSHGDVGGQLGGKTAARPLSNIPLVWMLECAEECGLDLPQGWRARFPTDVTAPSIGTYRGWSKLFLARSRRVVGEDPSERVHATARDDDDGAIAAPGQAESGASS